MNSSGKIILGFALVFCFVQAIAARPHFDGGYVENVKFDLARKCMGVEKDIEKDVMNVKHKVEKESIKLMKKATKAGSPECIESARLQAEEQLEEKAQDILDCVRELKDTLENLGPETTLPETMAFRNDFKNKLNMCKKSGKTELKAVQNDFSLAGKGCMV